MMCFLVISSLTNCLSSQSGNMCRTICGHVSKAETELHFYLHQHHVNAAVLLYKLTTLTSSVSGFIRAETEESHWDPYAKQTELIVRHFRESIF